MSSSGHTFVPDESLWVEVRDLLDRESILAMGSTAPNPAVAAVAVSRTPGGYLLFPGGTEPAGKRHAEIVALDRADAERARPEMIWISMEPCSRFGRTPPCTDRILSYPGLSDVHFFVADASLGGDGARRLITAGRAVHDESADERYLSFLSGFDLRIRRGYPRLHIKLALSPMGFIGRRGKRIMISGADALTFGALLRAKCDAVLVGPGTLVTDKPRLDLRSKKYSGASYNKSKGEDVFVQALLHYAGEITDACAGNAAFQPERIFLMPRRVFPGFEDFRKTQEMIAEATGKAPLLLFTESAHTAWSGLAADGEVLPDMETSGFGPALRRVLGKRGFNDVLIEGGAGLSEAVLPLEPQDRVYLVTAKTMHHPVPLPTEGDWVAIPPAISSLTESALFDLGSDFVSVRRATYG